MSLQTERADFDLFHSPSCLSGRGYTELRRRKFEKSVYVTYLRFCATKMLTDFDRAAHHVSAVVISIKNGLDGEQVQERCAVSLIILQCNVACYLCAYCIADGQESLSIRAFTL